MRITWLIYRSAKHSSPVTETKYLVPLVRERERGGEEETEKERRGEVLFFRYLIKSFAIHRARDSGTSRRFTEVAESFAANKINH